MPTARRRGSDPAGGPPEPDLEPFRHLAFPSLPRHKDGPFVVKASSPHQEGEAP
jgi:hypothetical protein